MGKTSKSFCIVSNPVASTDVVPGGFLKLMAVDKERKWRNGIKLTVSFWGDRARSRASKDLRRMVRKYAKTWTKYANIRFVFITNKPHRATIRIRFTSDGGPSSSAVGTDNNKRSSDRPTMDLGIDRKSKKAHIKRVTLHEFGHVLGCRHEHSHPGRPFDWDKEAVYKDHKGRKSKEWVRKNIFRRYSRKEVQVSKFDRSSIMLYPIPRHWTVEKVFSSNRSTKLSKRDISFIRKMYPYPKKR